MSGIYIHIPFCEQKCGYCNFYSICEPSLLKAYLPALEKEMEMRSDYLSGKKTQSLYIGGGTPSLLSPNEIEKIIKKAATIFHLDTEAEITLEANPNSLTEAYIRRLKNTRVNRLSIGIQSFFNEDLQVLNRLHSSQQAENCIIFAKKNGFENLSVDLIYGFPGLTLEKWKQSLKKVNGIPHLSCYQLTLERGTPLYRQIKQNVYPSLSEDESLEQYAYLTDFAKTNHYIHYETSNFCLSGYASRHNSTYWENEKYIGLGPGAHSYDLLHRQWNLSNVKNYISFLDNIPDKKSFETLAENILFEKENLTPDMRYNEYIMTSLRTIKGCDLSVIQTQFGKKYVTHLKKHLPTIKPEYYELTDKKFRLNETGSLFADFIASSLFI